MHRQRKKIGYDRLMLWLHTIHKINDNLSVEFGVWSVEFWSSGQVARIQKFYARIYLYAALPQELFLVFLLNVGNGLNRSDYLKVSCNPAEQSRLFPTLKKQNVTNISKFVQQQTVPNNTHYYKFGAQRPLTPHSTLHTPNSSKLQFSLLMSII